MRSVARYSFNALVATPTSLRASSALAAEPPPDDGERRHQEQYGQRQGQIQLGHHCQIEGGE